jgi:hypothetical protein
MAVPDAPTDLVATASSPTQVDLTWTDVAVDEDGYRIQRSWDGSDWSQIADIGPDSTSYNDTNRTSNSTYHYRVYAYNGDGDSDFSNTDSATTPFFSVTASAGAGASVIGVGTIAWTNPENITGSDDTPATAAHTASTTSLWLKATSFGFSIDSHMIIKGIVMRVEKGKSSSNTVNDSAVRLVKADVIQSTDKSGAAWAQADTYVEHGGSTDLWSDTWLPADINDSTFGMALSSVSGGASVTARVDHIESIVYYQDNINGEAGAVCGGEAAINDIIFGDGGAVCAGEALHDRNSIAIGGGIVIGGVADVEKISAGGGGFVPINTYRAVAGVATNVWHRKLFQP